MPPSKLEHECDCLCTFKPPKEGPYEEFYENGQLERRGTWTRAGRDGLFEQFFPNGQIKYRGMYINGSAEGAHEDYMKEDSLERIDCKGMALLSRLNRRKKIANEITVPITKNVRNTQPRVEAANE